MKSFVSLFSIALLSLLCGCATAHVYDAPPAGNVPYQLRAWYDSLDAPANFVDSMVQCKAVFKDKESFLNWLSVSWDATKDVEYGGSGGLDIQALLAIIEASNDFVDGIPAIKKTFTKETFLALCSFLWDLAPDEYIPPTPSPDPAPVAYSNSPTFIEGVNPVPDDWVDGPTALRDHGLVEAWWVKPDGSDFFLFGGELRGDWVVMRCTGRGGAYRVGDAYPRVHCCVKYNPDGRNNEYRKLYPGKTGCSW